LVPASAGAAKAAKDAPARMPAARRVNTDDKIGDVIKKLAGERKIANEHWSVRNLLSKIF
jgi:hypothetical protein